MWVHPLNHCSHCFGYHILCGCMCVFAHVHVALHNIMRERDIYTQTKAYQHNIHHTLVSKKNSHTKCLIYFCFQELAPMLCTCITRVHTHTTHAGHSPTSTHRTHEHTQRGLDEIAYREVAVSSREEQRPCFLVSPVLLQLYTAINGFTESKIVLHK